MTAHSPQPQPQPVVTAALPSRHHAAVGHHMWLHSGSAIATGNDVQLDYGCGWRTWSLWKWRSWPPAAPALLTHPASLPPRSCVSISDRGLETGHRDFATHVIRQNKILFAFSSPLNPVESEMGRRIMLKGDAAKDVAFTVKDCAAIYEKAISRGAVSVQEPKTESDEFGSVVTATVKTVRPQPARTQLPRGRVRFKSILVIRQKRIRKHSESHTRCALMDVCVFLIFQYGDTVHTFVQRDGYKGIFLPGYKSVERVDPLSTLVASPQLQFIDHIVGNQPDLQMLDVCNWYENVLGFHRFWSVDDSQVRDKQTARR